MATGANEEYWDDNRSQGFLKHTLLKRYLPIFMQRTSFSDGRAAYFDGYAGRGKYKNGSLGSAGQMLELAKNSLAMTPPRNFSLYFSEMKKNSFEILDGLCAEYREQGVSVVATRGDAGEFLKRTLPEISTLPAFLFLDPCGVGIPYADFVDAANRSGAATWPPTEFVLNFTMEGVRRIGGHVNSLTANENTMNRLSTSVGGDWWKKYWIEGTENPDRAVVHEFSRRLGEDTGMTTFAVPVRRKLGQKPVYYLIFGTRNPRGLWQFAYQVALTSEDWRVRSQAEIDGDQLALEIELGPLPKTELEIVPHRKAAEREAFPVIKRNIQDLLEDRGEFVLGDHPKQVFGEHLGEVRESVVRNAVKELHKEGLTSTVGTGRRIEDLVIRPIKTSKLPR